MILKWTLTVQAEPGFWGSLVNVPFLLSVRMAMPLLLAGRSKGRLLMYHRELVYSRDENLWYK